MHFSMQFSSLARLPRPVATFATATLFALSLQSPAAAQLAEPDGTVIPQALAPGYERDEAQAAANSLTLAQLFASRSEPVDWLADAVTEPATFAPRCSFTGTLVMRGGGCQIDFGWYNVNMSSATPPPDAEIHVLVPGAPGAGRDPSFNQAFQPQAGAAGMGAINFAGAPTMLISFTADSIRTDPNYLGGEIGFALKGRAGTDCSQTHFSEQRLNIECTAPGCMAGDTWIAAIIYQSQVTPNAYYIAFEDLPMSPGDFGGPGPYFNDGDFNDFVYFVEGITCDGGGEPCDTMLPGVCGPGLTECQPDGSIECRSQIDASDEKCDALDNDCDGEIDEGDLCDANEICVRGNCVPYCNDAEFKCEQGFVCVERVCVEEACAPGAPPVPKECPAGQVCVHGECSGPCDGVICPVGQVCEIGVCVDPCLGVTCDEDEICQDGVCVLNCNCRPCSEGVCNTDTGECVDPTCAAVTCTAPQVCVAGACADPCTNAVCPGGAACENGVCGEPMAEDPNAPPPFDPSAGAGPGLDPNDDPTPGGSGAGGTGSGAGGDGSGGVIDTSASHQAAPEASDGGCGCQLPGKSSGGSTLWLLGLALAGVTLLRRGRRGAAN